MSKFNVTRLVNHQALITGNKNQSRIVEIPGIVEAELFCKQADATDAFNAEVGEFLSPLNAALDKLAEAQDNAREALDNQQAIIILEDEIKGQKGRHVHLSPGEQIVLMIEAGDTARLRWANDYEVVVAIA